MFIIMCERSGGPCGYAVAPLKYHGKLALFFGHAKAEQAASKLNAEMNGPYAVGRYRYWVEEKEFT